MDTEDPDLQQFPRILNRQARWFKPLQKWAAAVAILFVIFLLFAPMMVRTRGPHPGKEEITNARQIGLALFEFETNYGAFPDTSTIRLVEKEYGTAIDSSGKSSNAFFRQIFAAQITQSEQMFFARTQDFQKPDGDIAPGKILEPGECGFSYISGLSSFEADPNTPIVLTPLIPGTTKFDPKPFDGKAIILHIDNSVRTYDIHKDGHIYDKGIDLLSPKHPVWNGKAPDIRYPE